MNSFTKELTGKTYQQMLFCGGLVLRKNIDIVNNLNVFPVPDGDTGTNMMMTFDSGLNSLSFQDEVDVDEVSSRFARKMLLGARGNSGVILSQIFKGIANGLSGVKIATALDLKYAFAQGIKQSYKAVAHPVEGTILTVFREGVEAANANTSDETSIEEYLQLFLEKGEETLQNTPELLPTLREAGVIDSGGAGLLFLFRGMLGVLTGDINFEDITESVSKKEKKEESKISFDVDSDLDYGYCTEFLLQLLNKKTDIKAFSVDKIVKRLEDLGGESIVAILDDNILKVHVHTMTPGNIFNVAQEYGEFISIKVENMTIQHSDATIENAYHIEKGKRKNLALIAVAKEDGFSELFKEMGADEIVSSGQSMNPSSSDFIEAFDKANADNIIVLPNNKNIILAARQAQEMYKKANIYLVETASLAAGFSALSLYNPGYELDIMLDEMDTAQKNAISVEVTRAVRASTCNGVSIKKNDAIVIVNNKIKASDENELTAIKNALNKCDLKNKEVCTIFYGINVSDEEVEVLTALVIETYPQMEINTLKTNQEMYSYIVAIE